MEKNPASPPSNNLDKTPKILDLKEAAEFLVTLWYNSPGKCYALVKLSNGIVYNHFCLDEWGDFKNTLAAALKWVSSIVKPGDHVFFQVLPLAAKPETGRGSAKQVESGQWLWADLDYKEVVDKAEFEGCKELEDYALECYYQDGDKWVYVKRPPLSHVLKEVEAKLGVRPTIIVDSGAGYHVYFRLDGAYSAARLAPLEAQIVDALGGDPQSKDLARILRLPGSINPRVNRPVRVIFKEEGNVIAPEKLAIVVKEVKEKEAEAPPLQKELRELDDHAILTIVNLLKDSYRPGNRQFLIMYLSGWAAKAGVSPVSVARIVKMLYDATGDSDPLKTRLAAIVYSYKKAGIDVGQYAKDFEAAAGITPYGLEAEIHEEEVKGKSGLQEILEETLGEDKALAVIQELQETLGALSPFKDSIVEIIDYEKQIYAVANLKKQLVARAKRDDNTLKYKEKVAVVAPTAVIVYDNPLGGVRKYEITFEGATLRRPLVIGPATIDEIADRVRAEGLVYHSRLWPDMLNAIVNAYVRKGRAEIRAEIEAPGFYMIDGRLVAVKYDIKEIEKEKLKDALLLLNELSETWFKHVKDKFALIIKWGAIAPFTYILKSRGINQKYLYLYGDSATGKTTLGRIILRLWGLDSKFEKTGASIDTEPRLGHVLSQSTFPVLINEPGGALMKTEITEMIKNAAFSAVGRHKFVRGSYTEYPALAPLIFTSNIFLPRDDALLNRFIVITFSYGEKIPKERQEEFKKVEPRLQALSYIGACIANTVARDPSVLNGQDIIAMGETLLSKCYAAAGLEKPAWLGLNYSIDEVEFSIIEDFAERLKKLINDLYARYVSRIIEVDSSSGITSYVGPDSYDLKRKFTMLLEKNMIPGVRLKEDKIIIMSSLLEEIGLKDRISLKSLAEIIKADYGVERLGDTTVKGIKTTLDQVMSLLT